MRTDIQTLPPLGSHIFFIGIGGIGMSGLAQLLAKRGYVVAGSDRGLAEPARQPLYQKLQRQGIRLFEQNGTGPRAFHPDALVVSSAIEQGNPDLTAVPGLPVLHRATALSQALENISGQLVTVAGSCGKTSVTGWLASALRAAGKRVLMVDGGYCCDVENDSLPGNFFCDDQPEFKVIEVDESDKSLTQFHPDFGLLLNIGHDHYSEDELLKVFGTYLAQCTRGTVAPLSLSHLCPAALPSAFFSCEAPASSLQEQAAQVLDYQETPAGGSFDISGFGRVRTKQSGLHSGWNAAAVLQMLKLLLPDYSPERLCASLADFGGVRQRFEVVGATAENLPVINDYAHNPEKIAAAVATARARFGSPIAAVFQPHGYVPFGQMREALGRSLAACLQPGDKLILLPVYYAGGTSSFTPKAEDVAADYAAHGLQVEFAPTREKALQLMAGLSPSCLLILGARDASLRDWSLTLIQK